MGGDKDEREDDIRVRQQHVDRGSRRRTSSELDIPHIRKATGDDFGPAVVTVLAHLRHLRTED